MRMQARSNRIEYIDIAKGMAILCVIMGHMGWEYADRIIYPFHMPLFLICSGYFISEKKDFKAFRKEKMKRLILPYLVTCACVCVLSIMANLVQGMMDKILPDLAKWVYASFYGSCIDYEFPFYIKGIGQIWFLLALFWALLIVKFFGAMKERVIIIPLLAYMAYISSQYLWMPFSIQAGAVSALFVWTGYELKNHQFLNGKNNAWIAMFAFAVWGFEAYFNIRVNICNNTIDNGIFSIVGGVIISYAVIWIAKVLMHINFLRTPLVFLGRNSLLILCFHELETFFFPWSIVYEFFERIKVIGLWADIIIFILKVLFAIICTVVATKLVYKPLQKCGFVENGRRGNYDI